MTIDVMPSFRLSSLRRCLLLVSPTLVLAACHVAPTLDAAQQFRLSAAGAVTPAVLVVDDRTPAQREARSYPVAALVSETNLAPDPATFVAQEMTRIIQASPDRARLEALLAGRTIHLRHVEIVVVRANPRLNRGSSSGMPDQVAVDSVVGLLGSALNVHGQVYVDIDVDLDDGRYISHATGKVNVTPFQDALIVPAHDAVSELLGHIADGRTTVGATSP